MTESASSIANGAPVVQPTLVGSNIERHANSRCSIKNEVYASISRENVSEIDEFLELIVLKRSSPSGQRVGHRIPEFHIALPFVDFRSNSKSSMLTTLRLRRTQTCARRRGAALRERRADRPSTARRCNLSNSNKSPNLCARRARRLVINLDSRVQLGEKLTSRAGAIPTENLQCIAFDTSVHNQTAFVQVFPVISNPNARTLMRAM